MSSFNLEIPQSDGSTVLAQLEPVIDNISKTIEESGNAIDKYYKSKQLGTCTVCPPHCLSPYIQ